MKGDEKALRERRFEVDKRKAPDEEEIKYQNKNEKQRWRRKREAK